MAARFQRSASLAVLSALAAASAAAPASAADPVEVVTCVTRVDDATLASYWGYTLAGTEPVIIPVGNGGTTATNNFFQTAPPDRGQPTTFTPGSTAIAVRALFPAGGSLRWALSGGAAVTATAAMLTSRPCDFDVSATITPDRAVAAPGDTVQWFLTLRNGGTTPFPWTDVTLAPTGDLTVGPPVAATSAELSADQTVVLDGGRSVVTPEACFGVVSAGVTAGFGGRVSAVDSRSGDNTALASVAVSCSIDAQITAPFERTSYAAGETAARTATVVNTGQAPLPLSALTLTDSTLGSFAPQPGTPDVIAPGARATFRAARVLNTGDCGTLASTATLAVGDATGRYVDGDPSSNTWTSSTQVTCATAIATGATSSTTTKTTTASRIAWSAAAPARAQRGKHGVLRITIRNTGKTPLRDVAAAISVPRRVIIAQALGRRDVRTANTVWRRVPTIAPGKTWTFTLRVRFPSRYTGVRRTLMRVYAAGKTPARSVVVTRLR